MEPEEFISRLGHEDERLDGAVGLEGGEHDRQAVGRVQFRDIGTQGHGGERRSPILLCPRAGCRCQRKAKSEAITDRFHFFDEPMLKRQAQDPFLQLV